jgi:hypothetical protein
MVESGKIAKLSKGKYYKPESTPCNSNQSLPNSKRLDGK